MPKESKGAMVVYWTNAPTPYTVDRLNSLAARRDFRLEAWFDDRIESGRSWTIEESSRLFDYQYLEGTSFFRRLLNLLRHLIRTRPDIIVLPHYTAIGIFGFFLARAQGARCGFRVLWTSATWVRRHWLKNTIKRFLFKRVHFIETIGNDGLNHATSFGASPETVYFLPHTVDQARYVEKLRLGADHRESFRKRIGATGCAFLYVGRMHWTKGVLSLIKAFALVQSQTEVPVSLLLAGDGPQTEDLKNYCGTHGLSRVKFTKFIQQDDLPLYYQAADVFAFPTLGDPYGVALDEALFCALPAISTTSAGEITLRVTDGENGFLVPPNNPEKMAYYMKILAENPTLRREMGKKSPSKVEDHTPAIWAEKFANLVLTELKKKNG